MIVDLLFALFLSSSIAILGCLLFEAASQLFLTDGEAQWQVGLGGAYSLAITGVLTAVFAALGGNIG